jgi:cyanate permease
VAALAGMMLFFGYTLSSTAPLLLGAVRDLSGGFDAVLWTLAGAGALLFLVDSSFTPARLSAGRAHAHGST